MRSPLTVAALAGALIVSLAPPVTAEPAPLPTVEGVPVLARTWIGNTSDQGTRAPALLTVHGVRRLESASVIYFSMGLPRSGEAAESTLFSTYGTGFFNVLSQEPGAGSVQCSAAALDVAGGLAYTALRRAGGSRCFGTSISDFGTNATTGPHAAIVAYAVIAPIPKELTTVDLYVGSQLLHAVPVEDGALEPLATASGPIVVGTGWPKVDLGDLSQAVAPAEAVRPLRTMVTDLDTQVSQSQESLEIDASVLFAVDKYDLTPAANQVIADAAETIRAKAPSGTLIVEGHTDSTADDAYNLKLSQNRAASVTSALKALLPDHTIEAVGKGEAEPIATNATAEGRALNRRVTIKLPE